MWGQRFSALIFNALPGEQFIYFVAIAMLFGAALYSAVGHGGASAYLAIMALAGFAPEEMRPIALVLNLIVSGIGIWRYRRAGAFDFRLFALFSVSSIPSAFIGGLIHLPPEYFERLLGSVLLASAAVFLIRPMVAIGDVTTPKPIVALPLGGGLGFLAGLTGTGGGIFLSPLILLLRWAEPRTTSGVAAAFIFVNSAAGLAGRLNVVRDLPDAMPIFSASVLIGALCGSYLGAVRLPRTALIRLLGVVLIFAGGKLLIG